MWRGRLCAAAPPMRARVRTRAGTRLRGALGVGTVARRGGSIHASEYVCIYLCARACVTRVHIHYPCICICENRLGLCMRAPACVLHVNTYMHYPFIRICENRSGLCMRGRVCDGDGSAVCARVGGLVLRARPEPETLTRASPCHRRGPRAASARRRSPRRWRSTRTSARGTPPLSPRCPKYAPPFRPGGAHYGGRARPGLRCGAAGCARWHRRCARACAHVQAMACAGPWV